MARIITDQTYARLVKHLLENETVALFQELLLSPKKAEAETSTETENTSDEAMGVTNGLWESNTESKDRYNGDQH